MSLYKEGFETLRNLTDSPTLIIGRNNDFSDFCVVRDGGDELFFCCTRILDILELTPNAKKLKFEARYNLDYFDNVSQSAVYVEHVLRSAAGFYLCYRKIKRDGTVAVRKHEELLTFEAGTWMFAQLLHNRPYVVVSVEERFPE